MRSSRLTKYNPLAPFARVGDGFCRKQRAPEGINRRDVRLGSPLAHGNTQAGAADICPTAGHDLRLFGQGLDHRRIEYRNIESLARLDLLLDVGVDLEMEINFIAGRALKLRAQFAHRGLGAVAA